jgi:hypothetical protein
MAMLRLDASLPHQITADDFWCVEIAQQLNLQNGQGRELALCLASFRE